jgi:hypothetical protein
MFGEELAKYAIIPFNLDGQGRQPVQRLVYRPWGTRTLKLKLHTGMDLPALILRPQRILPEEQALGIFQAYAEDHDAFRITWGGGHENGLNAKSKDVLGAFESSAPLIANDSSFIYFTVIHTGAQLPESATVTINAYENTAGNEVGLEPATSLPVVLQLPEYLPPVDDIIRIVPGEQEDTWIAAPGCWLPDYDSRWWPAPQVSYQPCERPPLIIRIEQGRLQVCWADEGNPIAIIEDFTQPSALLLGESVAYELFNFDEWSYALRVWFMWVDKYVGGNAFLVRHEIPDAERFDMIIRRKDGRVLLACTDLHWREVWARVLPTKILRATLGMPRETALKLAREKWSETWNVIWAAPARLLGKVQEEIEGINNPVDPYIRRLAAREATVTLKAGGMEAHIPTLHNVEQRRPTVMTSSDVRQG